MSIENLYPFAGDHAIKNATFVIEWSDPLSEAVIVESAKLSTKFKNLGLAHHVLNNLTQVKVNNEAPPEVRTGPGMMVFSREAMPNDATRTISISRENCVISIPDYTRWNDVYSDVERYLKLILDEVGSLKPIKTITMQYIDFFTWKDDPSELNLADVFISDGYMPPSVFEHKGFWHVHQGFLDTYESPIRHQRLDNINVDVVDASGARAIQVTASHRATLNEPLWQGHLKNKSVLDDTFALLHEANKSVLLKLFTREVCDRINLIAV